MAHDFSTLGALFDTVASRQGADPKSSYIASLLAAGKGKIARKVGEEAIEIHGRGARRRSRRAGRRNPPTCCSISW